MKKLSIICVLVLLLGLMAVPTFALEFKFDFYGGNTCYMKGDFEDNIVLVSLGDVYVDIWLVDWPTDRPSIAAINYYFQMAAGLDVADVYYDHLTKPQGPWDDQYAVSNTNEYAMGVVELGLGVPGPDIWLHTIKLRGTGGIEPIKATLGDYGVVLNVDEDEFTDVYDGNAVISVCP